MFEENRAEAGRLLFVTVIMMMVVMAVVVSVMAVEIVAVAHSARSDIGAEDAVV